MFLDLQEGILTEFVERQRCAVEDDGYQLDVWLSMKNNDEARRQIDREWRRSPEYRARQRAYMAQYRAIPENLLKQREGQAKYRAKRNADPVRLAARRAKQREYARKHRQETRFWITPAGVAALEAVKS